MSCSVLMNACSVARWPLEGLQRIALTSMRLTPDVAAVRRMRGADGDAVVVARIIGHRDGCCLVAPEVRCPCRELRSEFGHTHSVVKNPLQTLDTSSHLARAGIDWKEIN